VSDPLVIYTSGGIQKRKDGGKRWRLMLDKFAKRGKLSVEFKHPDDCIDPEFTISKDAELLYDDPITWAVEHEKHEKLDYKYIDECQATVFYYDGKSGLGTDLEFLRVYDTNKLIFFIRCIAKTKVPHWVMWRLIKRHAEDAKKVKIFTSLPEFKDYLKLTYGK